MEKSSNILNVSKNEEGEASRSSSSIKVPIG